MSAPENPRDGGQYPPPAGYGQNPAGYGPGPGYGAPPAGYGPGYGAPPAGYGPGYGAPPARPRNGFGIAALLLGVLAFVLSWTIIGGILFGIPALIFGLLGRGRAKRGEATNGGLSIVGIVLGIIGLLIAIGLVIFGVSIVNSPAGRNYQQCLEQSGGDMAKIEQCATEFSRQLGGG